MSRIITFVSDAFSISTGADGNCELRTQMELDRETIEHYLLNVTVEKDAQKDFALVGITVLDENDNIPQFIFDNELSLPIYFAAVPLNAPAFTHVVKVKAEDADVGNNSEIVYSLDEGLSDSKFFSIDDRSGEIETKISMAQLQNVNRKAYFDIKVRACDSPLSGQILCSKADVIINVIRDVHRFITTVSGVHLQQIHARKKDLVDALRQFTGSCSMLSIEKTVERSTNNDEQRSYDVYWYAINPATRRICRRLEFSKLFTAESTAILTGKLRPWLRLNKVTDDVNIENDHNESIGVFSSRFKTASVALIAIAIAIAAGALVAICVICLCYSRYKGKQRSIHSYPTIYPVPKLGTIFLPTPTIGASHDKMYETQMLELPISEDDFTLKGGYRNSLCSAQESSTRQT
uniref:Cadherin domain-containing protein n=1 Tax=Parascaris univalens TaxID=6257 RepID=A0A915B6B8_PARUN